MWVRVGWTPSPRTVKVALASAARLPLRYKFHEGQDGRDKSRDKGRDRDTDRDRDRSRDRNREIKRAEASAPCVPSQLLVMLVAQSISAHSLSVAVGPC